MKNMLTKITAVGAGALALAIAGSTVATADPTPAAFRTYAAVGSDTTQDVWNGLTNGTGAAAPTVASYDAFGTATIQTKSGGAVYKRPAGSGEGVRALSASLTSPFTFANGSGGTVNIQNQVNFARSSSRPAAGATGPLRYLPFARDAVSVVGRSLNAGLTNFTTAELTALYTCGTAGRVSTAAGANPVVNLGSGVTQQVDPKLPQTGSGTRSFFLSAIGVTTPGACVETVGAENDGTQLTATGQLIPFSAAQWIAQKNGTVLPNTVSSSVFRILNVNGSAPTAGSGSNLTPGALYGSASAAPTPGTGVFARDTYNVVSSTVIGTGTATGLEKVLTTDLNTTSARATISSYGFLPLSYIGNRANYLAGPYTN